MYDTMIDKYPGQINLLILKIELYLVKAINLTDNPIRVYYNGYDQMGVF